jgi:hypothetical protein
MPLSSTAKARRASDDSAQEKTSSQKPETSVHPAEPEDPKTAGAGREQRRVLGLNVGVSGHGQQHPETTAGQHATGSFTDGSENRDRKQG